jgi:LPXTG-site transpeptidase (sortase) family protein
MRSAPQYHIGKPSLPLVVGGGLVLAGVLVVAGLGSAAPAVVAPPPTPPPSTLATGTVTGTPASAPIAPGYRLQIPRLGIDLPLAEGDVARDVDQQLTPEGYAFHLPGTSIPGLGGNTYLYAHARVGMFLSLWNAKVGDAVFVSTPDLRALPYVVSEVHQRVPPDDVSWVQPTAGERLTLQTSTGPSPADPRFVVIAVPATTR